MIHNDLVSEGFVLNSTITHLPHGTWANYTSPEGESCQRPITPADEEIVSREYVSVNHCGSCGDPSRVWRTILADGRTHDSKCGYCYR